MIKVVVICLRKKYNEPMRFLLLIIVGLFIFPSDATAQKRKRKEQTQPMQPLPFTAPSDLHLERSKVFDRSFTGFALFDPEEQKMIYEYNSDKYFTPASNTKILTFYASLQLLGDSIPALKYKKQGDLMVVWGTGDPSFLNPHLTQNEKVYDFLKSRPEALLFCPANFKDARYGEGWMWSDYPYSYQPEKSSFPVYGNVAHFIQNDTTEGLVVAPAFLKDHLFHDPSLQETDYIGRAEFDNQFYYNNYAAGGANFDWHAPFRVTPTFVSQLLADTLHRSVHVLDEKIMPPADAGVLYSIKSDSVYQLMMQESDNFIAEQLLLLCSGQRYGNLNTEQVIDYVRDTLLSGLPDEPKWADGSGLSRYNLITPRSLVGVLDKIYQEVPRQRLLNIFPAGGVSGTIEKYYRNGKSPYVFAKTGTLRNNHCLSGYLLTSRGKLLIFSFMHNNYTISTNTIKREMERVLRQVYMEN